MKRGGGEGARRERELPLVKRATMAGMEIGIRELRAHLSRRLKRVAAGEEILVTDRGRPVARISPANERSKLEELIAAGLAEPAPRPSGWLPRKRIPAKGSVGDLVTNPEARAAPRGCGAPLPSSPRLGRTPPCSASTRS